MFRAFFLALGVYAVLLGGEGLLIDKVVLAAKDDSSPGALVQRMTPGYREVVPPEWAPWTLLSGGAVVILYSFTLPQKMKGG
jgi:hypothetical protein